MKWSYLVPIIVILLLMSACAPSEFVPTPPGPGPAPEAGPVPETGPAPPPVPPPAPETSPAPALPGAAGPPEEEITVEFIDSSYAVAVDGTSGFFKSGQEADIMLSGIDFNDAGGPLLFNHPGGIATDGTRLLLADRNNNRILIWNQLPEGNTAPDIVLGQQNFITNNPGIGLGQLNWPVAVATDGKHVLVADTYNDRILIWNSFPSQNGQPADLVLGGTGEGPLDRRGAIGWPWAVWTDGQKVIVTSTAAAQVLIWNQFPAEDDQPADIVLQLEGKFGTPRSIASDGKHLLIGDHNAFRGSRGNFFWKTFPTVDNQMYDFFIAEPSPIGESQPPPPPEGGGSPVALGDVMWATCTPEGKLLALSGSQIYIWESFPEDENDAPDLVVGGRGPGRQGYRFDGGDGSGWAVADGKVYLCLANGNKIVGFNSLPTRSDQHPDFAVGSPDIYTNTLETSFIISNPVPVSDGESLFVSSDFDRKLYIWKSLPDQSGAMPDIVYSFPHGAWDNTLFGKTLVLAGQMSVYIWQNLPLAGEMPDLVFNGQIGDISFEQLRGVALDEKYFYLADNSAGRIYVWEGIPDEDSNPRFTLTIEQPGRLSSDGRYLVASTLGSGVKVYSVANLSSNLQPATVGGLNSQVRFNLPEGAIVSHGHLFIGDTGFNRVLIWNRIEDAISGRVADVTLGVTGVIERPEEAKPEIGIDKLFWPAVPFFDGSYLWVGEFKFSERILRFSPQP